VKKRQRKIPKKNNQKVLKKVSRAVAFLYTIIYIAFILILLNLNVLPLKYLIPGLIITSIISIFMLLFLWPKKIKKKWKIISLIFTILLSLSYLVIGYYMFYTMNFMGNIKKVDKEVETFYVVALKDSKYEKIEDLKNKNIYILKSEDNTYKEAQKKLTKKINSTLIDLESSNDLIKKLDEDNAILISKSLYELLSEKKYNIDERSKILYKIKVEKKSNNIIKKVDVFEEPFNIYISGIDTSGNISNVARSDVNMVMTINPSTHKILLTSIPRDYYVVLHSSGARDKLTHSGMYGINESVQTIEDLLGIDINYYFRVNFNAVVNLVDAIGGININSDVDYSFTCWTDRSCVFHPGLNSVGGKCALAFARERHAYATGDRHRGENQEQVLELVINKITSSSTIISKYTDILNALNGTFQTNISMEEITNLVKMQIDDMSPWRMETLNVDGTGAYMPTYSYPGQNLYVMEPKMDTVTKAIEKLNEVLETP